MNTKVGIQTIWMNELYNEMNLKWNNITLITHTYTFTHTHIYTDTDTQMQQIKLIMN